MIAIFFKEFNSFLDSLIAYLVMGLFLLGIGLFMWFLPSENILDSGFADLEVLFSTGPFILMFLIPAVTMKSFAEEKKTGTLEILITKPISDFELIFAKFFACFCISLLAIAPTLVYYYSVGSLGAEPFNLDSAGIIGSYLGLILLSAVFTSIGIFSSSINDNQINAFIISVFFCYVFYTGFSAISQLQFFEFISDIINQMGIAYHYSSLSRGLIDSRDIIYFIGLISGLLFATKLVLQSRKWE
jgi:ABC-2 type transport system permease protein